MIVTNLKPPYYAVIFTTLVSDDLTGYETTAKRIEELAKKQEGFLGVEFTRNKIGITVSYWKTMDDIIRWKNNIEHTEVRNKGRAQWYKQYQLRVCKVEREYGFKKDQ